MSKLFAAAALLAVPAAAKAKDAEKEIAEGFIEGFVGDPEIASCVKQLDVPMAELEQAMKDLEKDSILGKVKAMKEIAEALKEMPAALKTCKSSEADVKKLEDALKMLVHPKAFSAHIAKDLALNGKDILKEAVAAVHDYHSKKWKDLGLQVGEMCNKIIVGDEEMAAEPAPAMPSSPEEAFKAFEEKFEKKYKSLEERAKRLEIFTQNLVHIETLQMSEQGTAKYSHLTPFADVSSEEFSSRHGFKPELAPSLLEEAEHLDISNLPYEFDWRTPDRLAVNPVQNQGTCGSCWAFSTVANIEGAAKVATGKLLKLSEQELVDCDTSGNDHGCDGGLPSAAFDDMIKNKIGLELETDYPYTGKGGSCYAAASSEKVFISSWLRISTDEKQMAAALMQYGPLSIGVNAAAMQWYHGGRADPWSILCAPKKIDHGVAVVGFGTQAVGRKDFWWVRNSWGPEWGEKGYWMPARGKGTCGVNLMVTTATGITIQGGNETIVV